MSDNSSASAATGTISLAVFLLSLGFLAMTAFQTFMMVRARDNLATMRANQERPIEEGTKLRQRTEALAGRTAKLAEEGNENARAVVAYFRRQGVEIKVPPK